MEYQGRRLSSTEYLEALKDVYASHLLPDERDLILANVPDVWAAMYASEYPMLFRTSGFPNACHVWANQLIESAPNHDMKDQVRDIHNFNPNYFLERARLGFVRPMYMKKGIFTSGTSLDTGEHVPEIRLYHMLGEGRFASDEITVSEGIMPGRTTQQWHHHRYNDEVIVGLEGITTCMLQTPDGDTQIMELGPGDGVRISPHTTHTLQNAQEQFTRHVAIKFPLMEFRDRVVGHSPAPRYDYSWFDAHQPVSLTSVGVGVQMQLTSVSHLGGELQATDMPQGLIVNRGAIVATIDGNRGYVEKHGGIWVRPGTSVRIASIKDDAEVFCVQQVPYSAAA